MTALERALALAQELSQRALAKGDRGLASRISRAAELVLDDCVLQRGGVFYVRSRSRTDTHHRVTRGHCDCQASYYGTQCSHRIAAYLFSESQGGTTNAGSVPEEN